MNECKSRRAEENPPGSVIPRQDARMESRRDAPSIIHPTRDKQGFAVPRRPPPKHKHASSQASSKESGPGHPKVRQTSSATEKPANVPARSAGGDARQREERRGPGRPRSIPTPHTPERQVAAPARPAVPLSDSDVSMPAQRGSSAVSVEPSLSGFLQPGYYDAQSNGLDSGDVVMQQVRRRKAG